MVIRSGKLAGVLLLAFLGVPGAAAPAYAQAQDTTDHKDYKLVKKVLDRLVAEMERPEKWQSWPPILVIRDDAEENAFAGPELTAWRQEKYVPQITVNTGFVEKVARRDPDVLALTMAHELGHLALLHAFPDRGKTPTLKLLFTRQQELDADAFGINLFLTAGFPYEAAVTNLVRFRQLGTYSSPEGLHTTHPSWDLRASRIDKKNPDMWRALSAFQAGVFYLTAEQYANAAASFRQVVRGNEHSYEAYANLGYALLMQYCDGLETKDLQQMDVGQIVANGFYRRPVSLEPVTRGQNTELWKEAVAALEKALELKSTLSLVRANLGLAYLVRPVVLGGKDAKKALAYFEEARKGGDAELDPVVGLGLLCNTGVAHMAAGSRNEGLRLLQQAEQQLSGVSPTRRPTSASSVGLAILYNQAMVLAGSEEEAKQKEAVKLLEEYLRRTRPTSLWWPVAHARYAALSTSLGMKPRAREELAQAGAGPFRPVLAVTTAKGVTIKLADSPKELRGQLGEPAASSPVVGLVRKLHYPEEGVSLLATSDEVAAVYLHGEKAPPLVIQERGVGATKRTLRVGMTVDELRQTAGLSEQFSSVEGVSSHRFYHDMGVGVQIRQGKVAEIVVAQVAR